MNMKKTQTLKQSTYVALSLLTLFSSDSFAGGRFSRSREDYAERSDRIAHRYGLRPPAHPVLIRPDDKENSAQCGTHDLLRQATRQAKEREKIVDSAIQAVLGSSEDKKAALKKLLIF